MLKFNNYLNLLELEEQVLVMLANSVLMNLSGHNL